MSAELGAVTVFDELLYRPGGMVHRWMTLMTTRFEGHAKRAAPERTGTLRAGITANAIPVGPKQMRGTIASNAPYSLYVLRGTGFPERGRGGRIYSKKGWAAGGDEEAAYETLWGSIDPHTKKFTRRRIKGVKREQIRVRKKGYWLAFGPDEHGPKVIAFSVAGQEPNNFLVEAWIRTSRQHSCLRGLGISSRITVFPGDY